MKYKRIALLLLSGLAVTGCNSLINNGTVGADSSGKPINPIIPNKSLILSKSLTIPAEAMALGAVIYLVVDPLSPNWQIEETRISNDRFRIALRKKRFTTGGDGEAAQVFYRRAEQIAMENGRAGYTILEFSEGVESTVPIAQRVSQGLIQMK